MASKRKVVRNLPVRRAASGFAADFADLFRSLSHAFFDNYRPELHYMRGPGPKWHAKHRPALAQLDARALPHAVPALIRVRVRR